MMEKPAITHVTLPIELVNTIAGILVQLPWQQANPAMAPLLQHVEIAKMKAAAVAEGTGPQESAPAATGDTQG